MMSTRQWFSLLTLFVVYLLLGASFFYNIENREETEKNIIEKHQRMEVEDMLRSHYFPEEEENPNDIFEKISDYCGKPVYLKPNDEDKPIIWDFYHALFFVITVCTTVGYGNLAPTTMAGRLFMIFYALIGVPVNGILMVNLGDYFGKSFIKLYRRWKTKKMEYDTARLSLISQIILYLVPGFTLLIFIPSVIIKIFEGWDYDVAVYYSFVTLSTIGFGDYVAAVQDRGLPRPYFTAYKVFLLFWMIIGLGYLVMVMGFISRAYRSKRLHALEHMLSQKIKRTPHTIREEIRNLLHDILLLKVKKVYKEDVVDQMRWQDGQSCGRSNSCPDLEIYRNFDSPMSKKRKRAFSESTSRLETQWNQSDSELDKIDKERTFEPASGIVEQSDLLLRVVNALGNALNDSQEDLIDLGHVGLPESEILASERLDSAANKFVFRAGRSRAASEVRFPFSQQGINDEEPAHNTWFGQSAVNNYKEFQNEIKKRKRTFSVPNPQPLVVSTSRSVFNRIKNTFRRDSNKSSTNVVNIDVEKQNYLQKTAKGRQTIAFAPVTKPVSKLRRGSALSFAVDSPQPVRRRRAYSVAPTDPVLEQTSIAELFRILSQISEPETEVRQQPRRKLGTASLTPPEGLTPARERRAPIRPNLLIPGNNRRRSSAFSFHTPSLNRRRFSLTPVTEASSPPPPYTPRSDHSTRSEVIRLEFENENSPLSARAPISATRRFSLRPSNSTTGGGPGPVQRQVWRAKEERKEL